MCESFQNALHKAQHSVYYVVHGKRPRHIASCHIFDTFLQMLFGSVEGLHLKACLLWVGLILSSTYSTSSLVLFEKTPGGKSFN